MNRLGNRTSEGVMSTRAGMPASRSAWPRTSGIQQLPRTCEQSSKPAVSSCGRCAHERPICHHEDGARLRLLWPATARGWDQPRVAALPCVRPGGPRQCSLIPAEYFKGRGFHWMRIRDDMRARQRESSALPPATWCSRGWGSLGRDVTDATRSRSPCVPALVELRV
jgi:hypothetical protein